MEHFHIHGLINLNNNHPWEWGELVDPRASQGRLTQVKRVNLLTVNCQNIYVLEVVCCLGLAPKPTRANTLLSSPLQSAQPPTAGHIASGADHHSELPLCEQRVAKLGARDACAKAMGGPILILKGAVTKNRTVVTETFGYFPQDIYISLMS